MKKIDVAKEIMRRAELQLQANVEMIEELHEENKKYREAWDKVIKEIEESKESVVGRYDVNTPEWDRPYAKTMRNNGRKEALEIIKKHLREVEE